MDAYKKVAWTEGMFLRPQHFQQQERYFEFLSHRRSWAGEPFFWGFRTLKIDMTALSVGKLSIVEADGVFPDGSPFSFPLQSSAPEPLDFSEGAVGQMVYLALPLKRPGTEETIFTERPTSLARYVVRDALVHDTNAIAGESADVQLAEPRVRLMMEDERSDAWLCVGVAHVVECRADRQLVLDPGYIPPVVACESNSNLISMLNELYGLVHQRADALVTRLSAPGRGGVSEVGEFLLLQLLNGVQPNLEHMLGSPNVHPEKLFRLLIRAVGELATFTEEGRRPEEIPQYDHDDLRNSFAPLILKMRKALSIVLEQNAIQIELRDGKYGVRIGQVNDRELLRSAQFVLAVHASVAPEVLRSNFPTQIKIGPVDKIRDLVNLHLPGVTLRSLPVAPRQLPYHAGYHYFELDTSTELWRQLQSSGTLALHIAGEFPELAMECWAIRI